MKLNKTMVLSIAVLLALLAVLPSITPAAHADPYFTISASPNNLGTVTVGHQYRVTITVTSVGGFAGTVALSASPITNLTASLNPTSVTVTSGGSATSTLTLVFQDCNVGRPPEVVEGTSGTQARDTWITWGIIRC